MDKESRKIKPSFQLHIDTQLLIERLREFDYGATITYRQMSEWIGRNVQAEARGILDSAMRYLAREEAIFFSSVRGSGIQRATESERCKEIPLRARKTIRNTARKMAQRLTYIPPEKLSKEEQKERNANISFTQFLNHMAKEKEAQKVIEAAPDDGKLSTGNVIDLLRKKAG